MLSFIPSRGRRVQLTEIRPVSRSSTRQVRQFSVGFISGLKQTCGISTPDFMAVCSTLLPSSAVSVLPSRVNVMLIFVMLGRVI